MPNGGKAKVKREGKCRLCRRPPHVRRLTRHHLVPKRRQGRFPFRLRIHDERNIVPLCRPCHDLVEKELAVRSMLRRSLLADEIWFVMEAMGPPWLNRVYPYWRGDPKGERRILAESSRVMIRA